MIQIEDLEEYERTTYKLYKQEKEDIPSEIIRFWVKVGFNSTYIVTKGTETVEFYRTDDRRDAVLKFNTYSNN